MALYAACGTFTVTGGSTANIEVNVTDTASGTVFQPKVVFFLGSVETATATGDHMNIGMGWAVSTTQRGCVLANSEDGVGTSDCDSYPADNACYGLFLTDGTGVDGLLDLVSMDSDGFTVVPDNAFATDKAVAYLALGGDSLTNAFAGSRLLPAATGNFSQTSVGFQGDCLFMLFPSIFATAFNAVEQFAGFNFGILKASEGGCVGYHSSGGNAAANADQFMHRAGTVSIIGDGTTTGGLTLVSFDADGWTLNRASGTSAIPMLYLVTKGMSMDLVNIDGQATAQEVAYSGLSFKPSALIGAMQYSDETAGDIDTGANVSYGFGTGPSNRASVTLVEVNGTDPVNNVHRFDAANIFATILSSGTLTSEIDIVSMNADGFTLNHNPVNGSAWPGFLLALGPAASASGTDVASTEDILRVEV